jgi:hypothetical protein
MEEVSLKKRRQGGRVRFSHKSAETGTDNHDTMGHGISMSPFFGSVQQAFANRPITNTYRDASGFLRCRRRSDMLTRRKPQAR